MDRLNLPVAKNVDAKKVNIATSKISRIRKLRVPILMPGAISGHKPGNTRGANYKNCGQILGCTSNALGKIVLCFQEEGQS